MNERDFVFWLHGFFEISNAKNLTAAQVQEVKNHIDLVLKRNSMNFVGTPPIFNNFPTFIPTGNQTICGQKPKTYLKPLSTGVGFFDSTARSDDIYICISKNPIWPSGNLTYSYYIEGEKTLESFGISNIGPRKVYTVIDNSLKPSKESFCSNLKYYKEDHLVGTHKLGPGICNLGNFPQGESVILLKL